MTHLSLNGNTVALAFALIGLAVIISIVGMRYFWRSKLSNPVTRSNNSPLKNTSGLHAFGVCIALLMTITLMSWTKTERTVHNYIPAAVDYEDVIEIPATMHVTKKSKPIPPPPPPNPLILEVDDLVEIEQPKEIPLEISIDAVVETSDVSSNIPQPAPPTPQVILPEDVSYVGEIVSIAEQMPRFPGCNEDDVSDADKRKCTETQLMEYVYGNLKYPKVARDNNITGRVILQFVIETNGDITDVKIVRDIGGGCGAAASKVIESMVEEKGFWTPGKQHHRKVKVRYTLPITFELNK